MRGKPRGLEDASRVASDPPSPASLEEVFGIESKMVGAPWDRTPCFPLYVYNKRVVKKPTRY